MPSLRSGARPTDNSPQTVLMDNLGVCGVPRPTAIKLQDRSIPPYSPRVLRPPQGFQARRHTERDTWQPANSGAVGLLSTVRCSTCVGPATCMRRLSVSGSAVSCMQSHFGFAIARLVCFLQVSPNHPVTSSSTLRLLGYESTPRLSPRGHSLN